MRVRVRVRVREEEEEEKETGRDGRPSRSITRLRLVPNVAMGDQVILSP